VELKYVHPTLTTIVFALRYQEKFQIQKLGGCIFVTALNSNNHRVWI